MTRWKLFLPAVLITGLTSLSATSDETESKEGWVSLFDGTSLGGWERLGPGTATYRVEDGTIVGKTTDGSPNSFLCSAKEYGNFELKFKVKVDDPLNSGVQIRSKTQGGAKDGRVHGPQVEIATNGTAGFIYGEGLNTGWLSSDEARSNEEAKAAFKKGEWNEYHVIAKGQSIKTWVNGVPVADLTDDKTNMMEGFIGLQVHGIGRGTGPYEVRWKDIEIKELD